MVVVKHHEAHPEVRIDVPDIENVAAWLLEEERSPPNILTCFEKMEETKTSALPNHGSTTSLIYA